VGREAASVATTLRSGPEGVLTTDGPFLETKEALGGFYAVEADDLDEVLALAAQLPETRASHGGAGPDVELRVGRVRVLRGFRRRLPQPWPVNRHASPQVGNASNSYGPELAVQPAGSRRALCEFSSWLPGVGDGYSHAAHAALSRSRLRVSISPWPPYPGRPPSVTTRALPKPGDSGHGDVLL